MFTIYVLCGTNEVVVEDLQDLDFQSDALPLHHSTLTTVLSTSLGKMIFARRFILNENILF